MNELRLKPLFLREPRLARPIKAMLDILGVLVDGKAFPAFNREPGVNPQRLRGLFPGLVKLSRLRTGAREPKTRPLHIGQTRYAFAQQTHRLPIALEHVIGLAHYTRKRHRVPLQRIKADVCLQDLDSSSMLADKHQDLGESSVDEVGIEREGSLEFCNRGLVLALVNQDMSKLSASFWQTVVEVHSRLR